jgi:hypothetical protein
MTWHGNWRLESLVREHSRARGTTRHVLLEIASCADIADGWTTMSLDDLVTATGHNRRTVHRSVTVAERSGELEAKRGTGTRQNRYRIRVEILETQEARHPASSGRNAPLAHPASSGRNAPLERGGDSGLVVAEMHASSVPNAPLVVPSRSPRARNREPEKRELTTTPLRSVVAHTVSDDELFPDLTGAVSVTVQQEERIDLVGAYVDACRDAGAEPVPNMPARVGAALKRIRAGGAHDDANLLVAVRELARRNEPPYRLAWILGDVERVAAGTPIGRVLPPTVRPSRFAMSAARVEEARRREQEERRAN